MKIFLNSEVKELDNYTIENESIRSIDLMERAAEALAMAICSQWGVQTHVYLFAGPGNNGGDALALARILYSKGYRIETFLFNPLNSLSPECEENKDRLLQNLNIPFSEVTTSFEPPILNEKDLVIDGLFGSGINKPLSGGYAAVVKYINSSLAQVVSIDIPSGLVENQNNSGNCVMKADYTLSLQLPKLSFLMADNAQYVGQWKLLDIQLNKEGIARKATPYMIMEENDIRKLIKPREQFSHKGTYGHALLVAGSYGMAGASVLAAKACVHSGVGLLTVHAPEANRNILQIGVPEAMVDSDAHEKYFATPVKYIEQYSAIGIGPGLGDSEETEVVLLHTLEDCEVPLVIDADAINILSYNQQKLRTLPRHCILTPHPKELERLVGKCESSYDRLQKARDLAKEIEGYVVLKGAWTAIATPEGNCYFNPTGNPGMATAGSGDVLTGVILSLLAQGYDSESAAKIGVYIHGLAGDLAKQKYGMISMTASDIINSLPEAWRKVSISKTF